MKLYTKGGDKGKTATYGGPRVEKSHPIMRCLGEIDQATVWLGSLRNQLAEDHVWQERLHSIQCDLMEAMAQIASMPVENSPARISPQHVAQIEAWIDETEDSLKELSAYFLVPGGNAANVDAHQARCSIRAGERILVECMQEYKVGAELLAYINRLSDLFFSLSRLFLQEAGQKEERWKLFIKPSAKS